jgi:membrane associated rhomboid family serine protease
MHPCSLHASQLFVPLKSRLRATLPFGSLPRSRIYRHQRSGIYTSGNMHNSNVGGREKWGRLGAILLPFVDIMEGRSLPMRQSSDREAHTSGDWRSPVYTLLLVQGLLYLASSCATSSTYIFPNFSMSIKQPQWWQMMTNGMMSLTVQQLFESMFFIYILGRPVERSFGLVGVWMSFLLAVAGGNTLLLWAAHSVRSTLSWTSFYSPVGVLGLLFVGLIFPRLFRKPLEVACLAPFALWSVFQRCAPMSSVVIVDGLKVGHWVHLLGGLGGSLIAYAVLSAIKALKEKVERDKTRKDKAAAVDETVSEIWNSAASAATNLVKKLDR